LFIFFQYDYNFQYFHDYFMLIKNKVKMSFLSPWRSADQRKLKIKFGLWRLCFRMLPPKEGWELIYLFHLLRCEQDQKGLKFRVMKIDVDSFFQMESRTPFSSISSKQNDCLLISVQLVMNNEVRDKCGSLNSKTLSFEKVIWSR
jgi:hypothetical protein